MRVGHERGIHGGTNGTEAHQRMGQRKARR